MNCCQNKSGKEIIKEKNKVSWKIIIIAVILLGLLVVSSLSIMYH